MLPMRTAILIPITTVALAAGALLFLRPEKAPDKSRPTKAGRDSRIRNVAGRSGTAEERLARLAELAPINADGAERQAMQLPAGERDEALETLVVGLATRDPARALKIAESIADPVKRGNSFGFVLAQWAGPEADAVFEWLETTDEHEVVKASAERMALPALAEADPARVAHWIADGKATPQATDAAVVTTVQRWVQNDADAAARWVAAFDDEKLVQEAMEPLVSLWTRQDVKAPAGWIEGLPAGTAKDEACAAYAVALASTAPEEAIVWAGKISDHGLGTATVKRIRTAK